MNDRQSIRQHIRYLRKNLSTELQRTEAVRLLERLQNIERVKSSKNIGVYLANDGELDLTPFIHWCWENNIKTYLPVIHPFCKGHLLFLNFHLTSNMVTNKYGIKEPKLNVTDVIPVNQLDAILAPLVAFDEKGNRLGMGGGYYDRTLATWYNNRNTCNKPYPIGLAHDCQKIENIPIERWDIPLPEIITPSQHFHFFNSNT